jgi:acyl-CoA reductase-like NAD-dependent aldehyde dehydrogenase
MASAERGIVVTGANLVAGAERSAGSIQFRSVDPRSGEDGGTGFAEATPSEVGDAARAAEAAFQEYATWSSADRAHLLRAIARELESAGTQIVSAAQAETGLSSGRLSQELTRTTAQLELFAEVLDEGSYAEAVIDTTDGSIEPQTPDLRRMLIPVGPVAVFGASNFPLAFGVVGTDTASALATGCPVIAKGHPAHPATSEICSRALLAAADRASAPNGIYSMVQGAGPEVGRAMILAPQIRAVGFTGSQQVGRLLSELAATRAEPIPVYAEMGSLNPIFVTTGALQERSEELAVGLAASVTLGNGQFCTSPNLIFVAETRSDEFISALAAHLRRQGQESLLTEGIALRLGEQLHRMEHAADVRTVVSAKPTVDCGFYSAPALMVTDLETLRRSPELLEEFFGPAATVVVCPEGAFREGVGLLPGSLSATIHAEPHEVAGLTGLFQDLVRLAGRVIWNGYPTGVAVCRAMHHGGPFPAASHSSHTSVGAFAVRRWLRGVAYQDLPQELLPEELKDENPINIHRLVNGEWTREALKPPPDRMRAAQA